MRTFVPASDDEIYAFIERHGIAALVPYSVGMRVARSEDAPSPSPVPGAATWHEDKDSRRAA
jgi:hypothetical protein